MLVLPKYRDVDDAMSSMRMLERACARRPGAGFGRRGGFRGIGGRGAVGGPFAAPTSFFVGFWDQGITLTSGRVSQWTDQSGNGNNVTQSDNAQRPVVSSADADFGGRDVIQFSSSSEALSSTNPIAVTQAQPYTVYLLFKLDAFNSQDIVTDDNGSGNCATFYWASSKWNLSCGTALATSDTTQSGVRAVCMVCDGASSAVYMDDFTNTVASGNAGTNSLSSITIGRNNGGISPIEGRVALYAGSAGAHSQAQRNQWRDEINRYYGTSIA